MPEERHAFITGVAALPVTRRLQQTPRDAATAVALAALEDAGCPPAEVDALFVTPPALVGLPSLLWSSTLAAHLGIATRIQATVECGGMTAALALRLATEAVRGGRAGCALCVATDDAIRPDEASEDADLRQRLLASTFVAAYGPYDGAYGIAAPIPYYAMSAQRYLHEYGARREDLALVAVRLRAHAAKNPRALFRDPITVDDVIAAPEVSPPLGLLDCAPDAAGAAAIVVCAREPAGRRAARIRGLGEAHAPSHLGSARAPLTRFDAVANAAAEAYAEAGIAPRDLDVAEVYGAFSATELIVYEDLGFFPKGDAARAVREGALGRTVLNPSGGRLSLGHPAGATPLYGAVEIVEQLRGEAGPRQVAGARLGLLHAEHGLLDGSLVLALEAV